MLVVTTAEKKKIDCKQLFEKPLVIHLFRVSTMTPKDQITQTNAGCDHFYSSEHRACESLL